VLAACERPAPGVGYPPEVVRRALALVDANALWLRAAAARELRPPPGPPTAHRPKEATTCPRRTARQVRRRPSARPVWPFGVRRKTPLGGCP
jgi:hypothetical protein